MGRLIFLSSRQLLTLPVGVSEIIFIELIIRGEIENLAIGLAGAVLVTLPGMVIFLCLQKYFVTGLFAKTGGQ